jgi:hypothetical protein
MSNNFDTYFKNTDTIAPNKLDLQYIYNLFFNERWWQVLHFGKKRE